MYKIKKMNAISDVVYDYLAKDEYEISSELENYDAIVVRSAKLHEIEFPASTLAIARAGAGVNNIPLDRCTQEGICVFNTPGANANGVKELAIAGMLMAARNIIEACNWAQTLKGQDDVPALVEKGKKEFVGPEVAGKKIGIIGLGAIGTMLANACLELGMDVYGYDPFMSVEAAWKLERGVKHATKLETIFTECDYISLHLPQNDKTKGMIGEDQFAMMKKDVILLNFARGGLVNTAALLDAIENGTIKKYVIDFPDGDVLGNKDIIAIPHLGASTPESEENCAVMAAKELNHFIQYGNIKNSVNLPDCSLDYQGQPRLTFIHKNAPNMVGQISALLGENGANIENMINKGRQEIAYTIIDVNKLPSADVVEKLSSIDGMIKVRAIDAK